VASDLGALRRAAASDPVPASGAAFVRYVGGREAATRALSGLDHRPQRGEYATPEAHADALRGWRSAQRSVQRWTAGEGKERRGGRTDRLAPAARRRAQTANRTAKRTAIRQRGLRATVTALIVINSPGKGGRDARRRTISNGGQGVPVDADVAEAILDALAEGDDDTARELLADGFLDGASLPPYTELSGASWAVWPDAE
jgi:hypothetical protein